MKSSNLLNFKQNKEQLYSLVESHISNGKYIKALNTLNNICSTTRSLDATLYISEILGEIQLYELSNQHLFNAIGQYNLSKLQLVTAYHDLSQNYLELNELTLASYYMRKVQSMVGIDDSTNEVIYQLDEPVDGKFRLVHPMSRKSAANVKDYASRLLSRGEYDKSIAMLKEVNEYFPLDNECKYLLALNYLGLKNFALSEQLTNEVLESDSTNIDAHCNLAIIYYYTNKSPQMTAQLEILNNSAATKLEHIYRIAMTMCECINHKLAYVWLQKFLDYKPFDINVMILFAICNFNLANYQQAKEMLLDIITLSGNDLAQYLLTLTITALDDKPVKRNIEYSLSLPYDESIKRLENIEKLNFNLIFNDNYAMQLINWALRNNSFKTEFHIEIIDKIAASAVNDIQVIKLFKQFLLDIQINMSAKKRIIFQILSLGYSGKLFIINYGFLVKFNIPPQLPHIIRIPLIHAISTLCCAFVFDEGFIKHIVKHAERIEMLCINYDMTDIIDNTNLCAGLLVRQLKLEAFSDKEICDKFNLDYRQLAEATERIEL